MSQGPERQVANGSTRASGFCYHRPVFHCDEVLSISDWRLIWWVPMLTGVVLGLLGLVLYGTHRRGQRLGAKAYRQRFLQLVVQLETVTQSVNDLGTSVKLVREPKVLDYYEGTLRLLETLLGAMRKVEPFGTDETVLNSAVFLVRDCRQRVGRIQRAFRDAIAGQPINFEELHGAESSGEGLQIVGCYFCSRPVISERLAQVKVRLDGNVQDVVSCKVCRDELTKTKKVKVLHFMQDGKPIHWSKVSEYHPSEDFWNINKRDLPTRPRHLELVPSHTEVDQSED